MAAAGQVNNGGEPSTYRGLCACGSTCEGQGEDNGEHVLGEHVLDELIYGAGDIEWMREEVNLHVVYSSLPTLLSAYKERDALRAEIARLANYLQHVEKRLDEMVNILGDGV